jgi:hypothetical protein
MNCEASDYTVLSTFLLFRPTWIKYSPHHLLPVYFLPLMEKHIVTC